MQYRDAVRGLQNFCTAFSINEKKGLWGTARHCAEGALEMREQGYSVYIDGKAMVVVAMDNEFDLAVLQSTRTAKAFTFYGEKLERGHYVEIFGYPYGLGPALTTGLVAALNVPIEGYHVSNILDVTVAGGNSGSPVVRSGKLVGVLWGKFTESNHSLAVPQEATYRFFRPFMAN